MDIMGTEPVYARIVHLFWNILFYALGNARFRRINLPAAFALCTAMIQA
jgi:hypothetical protein